MVKRSVTDAVDRRQTATSAASTKLSTYNNNNNNNNSNNNDNSSSSKKNNDRNKNNKKKRHKTVRNISEFITCRIDRNNKAPEEKTGSLSNSEAFPTISVKYYSVSCSLRFLIALCIIILCCNLFRRSCRQILRDCARRSRDTTQSWQSIGDIDAAASLRCFNTREGEQSVGVVILSTNLVYKYILNVFIIKLGLKSV